MQIRDPFRPFAPQTGEAAPSPDAAGTRADAAAGVTTERRADLGAGSATNPAMAERARRFAAAPRPEGPTTSPLLAQLAAMAPHLLELSDATPAHHRAFAEAAGALGLTERTACARIGVTSLSVLLFLHGRSRHLDADSAALVEILFASVTRLACRCDAGPKKPPLRTPTIDIAGYGTYEPRAVRASDPLFIGMSGVVAGSTIEIRNRSAGIAAGAVPPWIALPVDTAGVRAEDGRLHLSIGPEALAKLGFHSWDQFEIRQRAPDGRVSEPVMPDLGSRREDYQLPASWNTLPPVTVGDVLAPPGWVFRGLADTDLAQLNPAALSSEMTRGPQGETMFRVQAELPKDAPFAGFTEPRAQVILENLRTGERSATKKVAPDGTFSAAVPGRADDPYVLRVFDQGRGETDLDRQRLLTFASGSARPIVAYSPAVGQPEATDLIPGTLFGRGSAHGAVLASDRGTTPGSVVTVTDLETNQAVRCVADQSGSFQVPAELAPGRAFEIKVENPYVHAARASGQRGEAPEGSTRVLRVQVTTDRGALVPVAVDQFPPSASVGHVAPASLGERRFDPNVDVDFIPTSLTYERNSRGDRTGRIGVDYRPGIPLQASGSLQTNVVYDPDEGKLQIVVDPHLSQAVGVAKADSATFSSSSTLASTGGWPLDRFTHGFRDHLDVEVVRPDGTLMGVAEMRPSKTSLGARGEVVEDWAFSGFRRARGVAPLLGQDAPKAAPPRLEVSAWIEPSAQYGQTLTPDEVRAFDAGKVAGRMVVALDVQPPQGMKIGDIASLEVVNLTAHPEGFAGGSFVERAKIGTEGKDRALFELASDAIERLGLCRGDRLQYRAVLKDGTVTRLSSPVELNSPARKTSVTVRGDFISSGVVTRWEQKPIGDTFEGPRPVVRNGELTSEVVRMAPPPARDAVTWAASVAFRPRSDGLVEMDYRAGSLPADAKLTLSSFTTKNPYGSDSLYATTTDFRDGPLPGERSSLVFPAPRPDELVIINAGGQRVVYPPSMASDPRVRKLLGEG